MTCSVRKYTQYCVVQTENVSCMQSDRYFSTRDAQIRILSNTAPHSDLGYSRQQIWMQNVILEAPQEFQNVVKRFVASIVIYVPASVVWRSTLSILGLGVYNPKTL